MKHRTETFKASTQYNDWIGSAALDDADIKEIYSKFEEQIKDERILGIEFYMISDPDPEKDLFINLSILVGHIERNEFNVRTSKEFPRLKRYTTDIGLDEFARLFKRISIKCSNKNILGQSKIKITHETEF